MYYFIQSLSHFPLTFCHTPYRSHSTSDCLICPYSLHLPKFATLVKLLLCSIRLSNHIHLMVIASSKITYFTFFQTRFFKYEAIGVGIGIAIAKGIAIGTAIGIAISVGILV